MNLLRPAIRSLLTAALVLATVQTAAAHPGEGRWQRDRDDYSRYERDDQGDRDDDYARVLEVRPHYVELRVDVPERRCRYERGERGERNHAGGTLLGGLIGGVLGHNLAGGDERGFATAAGAVVGGVIGHEVARQQHGDEGGDYRRDDGAERCQSVVRPRYERRLDGYDVVYEYGGRRYQTRLPYDPGSRLDVSVATAPSWR
jgi:uncharacterized protein YcfJ